MATTNRLTKQIRKEIIQKVLEDTFSEWKEKLRKTEGELAATIYKAVYWNYSSKMDELPDRAFERHTIIAFEFTKFVQKNGREERQRVTAGEVTLMDEEMQARAERFFYSHCYYSRPKILMDAGEYPELCEEAKKYVAEETEYFNAKGRAIAMLKELLASVRSFKQLREAWPEGISWIDEFDNPGSSNLPAVIDRSALNALLCSVAKNSPCCK